MSDTIPTNEEVYRYDVEESVFIEADKWCEAQLGPRPEGVTPEIVQIAGRTLHGWWIQRAKPLVVVERGTMKRRRRSLAERMLAYEREVARRMEPLDGGFSMRRAGLEAEWRRMRPMDAEILDAMRAHPTHGMIEAHQVTAGQALETEVVEETAMRDHATHGMTGGETHQVTAGQALETELINIHIEGDFVDSDAWDESRHGPMPIVETHVIGGELRHGWRVVERPIDTPEAPPDPVPMDVDNDATQTSATFTRGNGNESGAGGDGAGGNTDLDDKPEATSADDVE